MQVHTMKMCRYPNELEVWIWKRRKNAWGHVATRLSRSIPQKHLETKAAVPDSFLSRVHATAQKMQRDNEYGDKDGPYPYFRYSGIRY
ncbi:hypothetical protein POSPLADRAFT_1040726, partial [Postia placenta MAD-698-R-SB12]